MGWKSARGFALTFMLKLTLKLRAPKALSSALI
jgi:hypothetical protein